MMFTNIPLYIFAFSSAVILGLILTPAARAAAILLNIIDHPTSAVKTHKEPVPYLGGAAIFLSFTLALLMVRVLTSFPTGTLRSLRGIIIGGTMIFFMGLIDDIKHGGLHYQTKFIIQVSAAIIVMLFGVRIRFIQPNWLAGLMTIVWIVGITNAFNIIDIMDGLSSGVAMVSSLCFLFIALPTEDVYVNFMAAALAGATLGFFPYNVSKSLRIFMGDSGSLVLGFISASMAMGASYGESRMAVLAPLLILGIPIYETTLVFCIRISHGISPFLGSKDHFPLRLERLKWSRKSILRAILFFAVVLGIGAAALTRVDLSTGLAICAAYGVFFLLFTMYVLRAPAAK